MDGGGGDKAPTGSQNYIDRQDDSNEEIVKAVDPMRFIKNRISISLKASLGLSSLPFSRNSIAPNQNIIAEAIKSKIKQA